MPSINADGSINYNTDTAFDMDNEDEYYHFVCGLIAASMQISDKNSLGSDAGLFYVNPSALEYTTRSAYPGLTCCMNISDHFGVSKVQSDTDIPAVNADTAQMKATAASSTTYIMQDSRDIFYCLVNTSSEDIVFDDLTIKFNAAGCDGWAAAPNAQKYQPYRAVVKAANIFVNQRFSITEEDLRLLTVYFTSGLQYLPTVQFVGDTKTTLHAGEAICLMRLTISIGSRNVYVDGEKVSVTATFFGAAYDICGCTGWNGRLQRPMQMPSYATNNDTEKQYGIWSHCTRTIHMGDPFSQNFQDEYPNSYPTFAEPGEETGYSQIYVAEQTSTGLTVTLKATNNSEVNKYLTLRILNYSKSVEIPAGFSGTAQIEVEVPPAITDNTEVDTTPKDKSAAFNVETEDESLEVSDIKVKVDTDPSIPVQPSKSKERKDKLVFTDSLYLTITGTPKPDIADKLLFTDEANVTHIQPLPQPDMKDKLLFTDDSTVLLKHDYSQITAKDKLMLADEVYVNQTEGFSGSVKDKLSLADTAQVTKTGGN